MFALLTESGLGQFYDLTPAPGSRTGATTEQRQWLFLDDPAVQEKLLDYVDERRAKVTLHLPAIHCLACVWLLENLFRLRPGIGESRVNFARREAGISFDPALVKLSEIAALLASLGYEPALTFGELDRGGPGSAPAWRKKQWLQIGVAGFGFGNAMLLALPGYLGLDSASGPWFKPLAGWLGLALAAPVLVYSASDYWRAAWTALRQRLLTLDVPIALGLAAIFGQSLFEVAAGRGAGYGDSLTGLIFFLLCGRMFQRKTFDHLAFDRDYKGFFPLAVTRIGSSRSEETQAIAHERAGLLTSAATNVEGESVSISEIVVGDRLLIRHGELVPADATLVSDEARVDYSFVTGESEPVIRGAGELLYAGGRQTGGAIEVETVRPVSESYLTSLWNNEVFRKERDDHLDSQINRYSRRFTVVVMTVAAAAALFWMIFDADVALKAFTSVLIVACPCALALASPLTLGTAQRRLAEQGVFLRNAQVVERISGVDTVVLDKTGTLTTPGAGTVAWHGAALNDQETRWIYAMTRTSTHPLAARIKATLPAAGAETVRAFVETSGCGMEGHIGGRVIWLGSAEWLASRGAGPPSQPGPQHPAISGPAAPGDPSMTAVRGSTVHVSIDGQYRGRFTMQSALRPEVDALIRQLRGSHQLVLLSGDSAHETDRFRSMFGAQARVEFNRSPHDKLNIIRELQDGGRKVMMVGDGLNDAGALQQADVGVAMVEQVGTFSPASDVILKAKQLPRLAEVLAFSRRAARVVRLGFVVSGLYNIVGISIAAAGLLSPLVCAVLMPLSSVTVVLFSMGTTGWLARSTFKDAAGRRENARPKTQNPETEIQEGGGLLASTAQEAAP